MIANKALKIEEASMVETKKNRGTFKTADGHSFFITKNGVMNLYYAISGSQTIAVGATKREVRERGEAHVFPPIYKKPHNYNIGQLSPIQLSALVDNGTIGRDEVTNYYEKHYMEDINWVNTHLLAAVERFARAKYFDLKEDLQHSIFWKKFQKEGNDTIGSDTFFNIMKYIFNDNINSITEGVVEAVKKQLDKANK